MGGHHKLFRIIKGGTMRPISGVSRRRLQPGPGDVLVKKRPHPEELAQLPFFDRRNGFEWLGPIEGRLKKMCKKKSGAVWFAARPERVTLRGRGHIMEPFPDPALWKKGKRGLEFVIQHSGFVINRFSRYRLELKLQ